MGQPPVAFWKGGWYSRLYTNHSAARGPSHHREKRFRPPSKRRSMTPSQPPSPFRLRWSGVTDRGKVRKNNEDSFVALQFDAQELRFLGKVGEASGEHNDFIFAVSDGMGGAMAGEFASRITVDKIAHLLPRSYRLATFGMDQDFAGVLEELFDQVHRALTYFRA